MAETLPKWVRLAERDSGQRAGLTSADRARLKALAEYEREYHRLMEAQAMAA
jgi:hypothetical protein